MKLEEFEKIKKEYLEKCKSKVVNGELKNSEDINKADFNGIYVIYNKKSNEIIYIGSAYTKKFTIKNRLNIHLRGHDSNTTIIKTMQERKTISFEEAKKRLLENYNFRAYEWYSLEYKLIEDVDSLYNTKGKKK